MSRCSTTTLHSSLTGSAPPRSDSLGDLALATIPHRDPVLRAGAGRTLATGSGADARATGSASRRRARPSRACRRSAGSRRSRAAAGASRRFRAPTSPTSSTRAACSSRLCARSWRRPSARGTYSSRPTSTKPPPGVPTRTTTSPSCGFPRAAPAQCTGRASPPGWVKPGICRCAPTAGSARA